MGETWIKQHEGYKRYAQQAMSTMTVEQTVEYAATEIADLRMRVEKLEKESARLLEALKSKGWV